MHRRVHRSLLCWVGSRSPGAFRRRRPRTSRYQAIRKVALTEVDKQLINRKLLDPKTGGVSKDAQEEFGFERQTCLPTAGVIVKGCLDACNVCEPELQKKMQLELELLKRQIELMDKD